MFYLILFWDYDMKMTPEKIIGTFANVHVVGILDLAFLWKFAWSSIWGKVGVCTYWGMCAN